MDNSLFTFEKKVMAFLDNKIFIEGVKRPHLVVEQETINAIREVLQWNSSCQESRLEHHTTIAGKRSFEFQKKRPENKSASEFSEDEIKKEQNFATETLSTSLHLNSIGLGKVFMARLLDIHKQSANDINRFWQKMSGQSKETDIAKLVSQSLTLVR